MPTLNSSKKKISSHHLILGDHVQCRLFTNDNGTETSFVSYFISLLGLKACATARVSCVIAQVSDCLELILARQVF